MRFVKFFEKKGKQPRRKPLKIKWGEAGEKWGGCAARGENGGVLRRMLRVWG